MNTINLADHEERYNKGYSASKIDRFDITNFMHGEVLTVDGSRKVIVRFFHNTETIVQCIFDDTKNIEIAKSKNVDKILELILSMLNLDQFINFILSVYNLGKKEGASKVKKDIQSIWENI